MFSKVTATILPPVGLAVDPGIEGKRRRIAAGAALYQVMSDLVFQTTSTDRTIVEAVIDAAQDHGGGRIAVEDPLGRPSYRKLLAGVAVLGRKLMPFADVGEAVGVMLPNANGAAVTTLALMSAGRVPAMINFTRRRRQCARGLPRRVSRRRDVARFIEKGGSRRWSRASTEVRLSVLEDIRPTISFLDRLRGLMRADRPCRPRRARRDPGRDPLHLRLGGHAQGRRALPSQYLANAAQAEARIDFGRTDKVFNVLPVFHSFGLTVGLILPLVYGVRFISIPRRCTTASCRSSSTARTRPSCSAPIRSSPAMRAPRMPTTSARCATSSPAPSP